MLESAAPVTREAMLYESDKSSFSSRSRLLASSITVGALTGGAVAGFKTSITMLAIWLYGSDTTHGWVGTSARLGPAAILIPALGGLLVSALRAVSPGRRFGPSLAGHVAEVEGGKELCVSSFATRSAAAVATLGTGNSLGPEGPAVEIGFGVSRLVGSIARRGGWSGVAHLQRRQRQMLAAGAAAGVAAGFNAPLAGVFFALEVVAAAVRVAVFDPLASESELESRRDSAELDVKSRTSISGIVLSSLVSAVVAQELLGLGHALTPAMWPARLRLAALPLYLGLGATAGATALLFKRLEAGWRGAFASGGSLRRVPMWLRPAFGGLLCGLVSIVFPQVLFFGYSTLDAILVSGAAEGSRGALLGGQSDVTALLRSSLKGSLRGADGAPLLPWPGVGLLCAKLLTTSLCVASGLVGGTFAPSLLLGATLGVVYQQLALWAVRTLALVWPALAGSAPLLVANVPAFAMVGSAAFLASVFHAPLTAALLLFELTRGYELVLPLLCAAGMGPLVYDAIERRLPAREAQVESELPDFCLPDLCLLEGDEDEAATVAGGAAAIAA